MKNADNKGIKRKIESENRILKLVDRKNKKKKKQLHFQDTFPCATFQNRIY